MQNDLWNYCLNFYARPGVEHACLSLQDQGLDICLLLCAVWLQERAVAYSETRLEQLKTCTGLWQREVLRPLRQLRTCWREAAEDDEELAKLRIRVKALELEAEGTLLRRLESATLEWSSAQSQDDCDWLRGMASSVGHPNCDMLQTLRASIKHV